MGVPYAEVIGDPIAHSKSPLIHKFWLEKLGIEGDYRATRVTAAGLPTYLATRRADPDWRGCNVTMPLKMKIGPLLDRIDPLGPPAASAVCSEAVNCVFWDADELVGCNTDASGVAMALDGTPMQHRAAVVIGSGAAARTSAWCLADEEVGHLRILARNKEAAAAILRHFRVPGGCWGFEEADDAFDGATAIINATPLGMAGFDGMPSDLFEAIRHSRIDATVLDMVYHPIETEFLSAARQYGRRTVDGLEMLVGQAQDSFRHFYPADPPWEDAELRELLTQ